MLKFKNKEIQKSNERRFKKNLTQNPLDFGCTKPHGFEHGSFYF